MLMNAAKCQGYTFYCFSVIKGKRIERREDKHAQSTPRAGLSKLFECKIFSLKGFFLNFILLLLFEVKEIINFIFWQLKKKRSNFATSSV